MRCIKKGHNIKISEPENAQVNIIERLSRSDLQEMHEESHNIKTSKPENAQIDIIKRLRKTDLQESNERTNNKASAVLKNTEANEITELEQKNKIGKTNKMYEGYLDYELKDTRRSPESQNSGKPL